MLLIKFNKEGYLQLKKDREVLLQQIAELQDFLDDFNFAYPFLNSLFEPEFKVFNNDGTYFGDINIVVPFVEEPMNVKFEIGLVSDYIGEKDPKLIDDFYHKSQEILKRKFPTNFK
jgi:hypothetical protein